MASHSKFAYCEAFKKQATFHNCAITYTGFVDFTLVNVLKGLASLGNWFWNLLCFKIVESITIACNTVLTIIELQFCCNYTANRHQLLLL